MTTTIPNADHAAKAIAITINTIDFIAGVTDPVYRAGQRAGRLCKPILRQAIQQIDWREALQITILGLVIAAVATNRFCRWAGPALIQASAALGRWYAGLLVDRESPVSDPQAPEDTVTSTECVPPADAPGSNETTPAEPEPAAATPDPTPTSNTAPRTTRKPSRRRKRPITAA